MKTKEQYEQNEAQEQDNDNSTAETDQNGTSPPSSGGGGGWNGPAANDDVEVAERHRQHLMASGLKPETIRALRYATVDTTTARDVLGWPEEKKGDPAGLLIPYPNVPGYAKVRPDKPRVTGGDGPKKPVRAFTDHNIAADLWGESEPEPEPKAIKYEAPLGSDLHCYIPLPICPALTDPEERLYLTEGEKKAAVMCQEGAPCISLPGVSGGHDVEHRREAQDWGGREFVLHPELRRYVLPEREVCILFDTPDMEKNVNVIRSAVRTARMVKEAGAIPLVGYVPAVPGLAKTGVDDYFVAERTSLTNERLKERILSADFADARPVGPNSLLTWLAEQKQENGWAKDEVRAQLRRAAVWARVWHEGEERDFRAWVRAASKEFYVSAEDILAMVEHLPVRTRWEKPAKTGYQAFTDADVLEHCVPVLNEGFALLRTPDGNERTFSVNSRREVTYLLEETHLIQALHDALKAKFGTIPPPGLLYRAIELWKKECPRLSTEPEPFCFKGDALTFKRFDWEPSPGEYPAWEEFLSRLSDRDAFMAIVWSCFQRENKSRQYLWLRGNGQDGKSRVLSTILEVFGPAATGITGTQMLGEKRFLYSAIYGKRVVVYADCKSAKFGMTEFVRNCTSGDPVLVEFKHETGFSWPMRVKLLIASNPKPEITGQTADASRMVYIEVAESKNKDDPTWGDRLRYELPAFLHACRDVYQRLCPHHGDIALGERSRDLQAEAVAAFEERWHELFDANFRAVRGRKTAANAVSRRLKEMGVNNNEIADFKTWMEREHSIHFRRSKSERYYENLEVIDLIADLKR